MAVTLSSDYNGRATGAVRKARSNKNEQAQALKGILADAGEQDAVNAMGAIGYAFEPKSAVNVFVDGLPETEEKSPEF